MDRIENIINNAKPNNKKITNDTYISRIKKLVERGIDPKDIASVKSYLQPFAYKTKRSYYISVVVYLKAIGEDTQFYDKCIKEMWDKIQTDDKQNEASLKEKGNIVKRQEIERILKNLEELILGYETSGKIGMKYFRTLQNYLIVNLYFLIPPLRNDYVLVEVFSTLPLVTSKDVNYLDTTNKKLYVNRYKTDRKYGSITVDVPDKIIDIVNKIFRKREEIFPKLIGQTSLLLNTDLKKMSKVNLIQNLNTIFKRKVSVTMLRKSYISEKYPVNYTIEEMEGDARTMGHSVALQQSTYRKRLG